MGEEFIEEIDWEGNVIAVHPKSFFKQRMFPHKVSLIIPRTENNKFILSKRAEDKYPWPGVWVCAVGGKVSANESYEEAAKREMQEEAEMDAEIEPVSSFKYNGEDYKAIFKIFTTKNSLDINTLKPNPEEVQYFQSFELEEIKNKIINNPDSFAPTFRVAIEEFIKNIN